MAALVDVLAKSLEVINQRQLKVVLVIECLLLGSPKGLFEAKAAFPVVDTMQMPPNKNKSKSEKGGLVEGGFFLTNT